MISAVFRKLYVSKWQGKHAKVNKIQTKSCKYLTHAHNTNKLERHNNTSLEGKVLRLPKVPSTSYIHISPVGIFHAYFLFLTYVLLS